MKLLSIFGTRPEAIKMAPVLAALGREPGLKSAVCVTGQHREMLDPVLDLFGIIPAFDLDLMEEEQPLNVLLARAILAIDSVLASAKPDRVIVHGDTISALAGATAAFNRRIPVAHVEAGLRTYDNAQPWPEEVNRRTIDHVSDLLFAPTPAAKDNLIAERACGRIFVTGNTGVDAVEAAAAQLAADAALRAQADAALPVWQPHRKLLLVTCHRRESFGPAFAGVCAALTTLARRSDLAIAYPLHLNPAVASAARAALCAIPNLHLLPPLPFPAFIRLMQRADVILTDSGGIQEEAPSLGKAVLVMRQCSERPEALEARSARLVGTEPPSIVAQVAELIEAADQPHIPLTANPYGDGRAAERIVAVLAGRQSDAFGTAAGEPAAVQQLA